MTQILVTLEEGTNFPIIESAIRMIKGVRDTLVTNLESKSNQQRTISRLEAFDRLAGSVSSDMIDLNDDRTKYLLSK